MERAFGQIKGELEGLSERPRASQSSDADGPSVFDSCF